MSLIKLHKRHIRGTAEKAFVSEVHILLCNLTNAVAQGIGVDYTKVYVTTRMLKHLYDKKPAEEYDSILKNLFQIVRTPDSIYANKGNKRGSFIFLKSTGGIKYVCSIELQRELSEIYIVTGFRLRKESYLNNYELIWSWKGDIPSS